MKQQSPRPLTAGMPVLAPIKGQSRFFIGIMVELLLRRSSKSLASSVCVAVPRTSRSAGKGGLVSFCMGA